MPDAGFLVELVHGVPVVTTPEEIDITNALGLRTALLDAAVHGRGPVVVDMSQTQFCDSAGLHALIRAHKRTQAEDDDVLVVISAATVLRIFTVTGLDRIIPNFPSLEEALAQATALRPAASSSTPAPPEPNPIASPLTGAREAPGSLCRPGDPDRRAAAGRCLRGS